MRRIVPLAAVFGLILDAPLPAQMRGLGLAGGGVIYNAESRIRYLGEVKEQTGVWYGGEGHIRVGPVRVGMRGMFGSLSGVADSTNPGRTVRTSAITLHVQPAPVVMVGVEAEARRFDSDVGIQVWRLIGPSARITSPLGLQGLAGTAELAYFPMAELTGGQKLKLALRGEFGVTFAPPRSGVMLRLAYRLERFDFEADETAPARLEQVRGLVAGLGLRLGS